MGCDATASGDTLGTAVWRSGHASGTNEQDGNGGVSGDRVDGWFIKDAAVVYNTESTPRPTGRDDDLVSTGFAMDNNMEHLKHSVTHEHWQYTVTEAAPSAEEAGSAEETVDAAGMEAGSHVPVRGSGTAGWAFDEGNGCGDGVQGCDGMTRKQRRRSVKLCGACWD